MYVLISAVGLLSSVDSSVGLNGHIHLFVIFSINRKIFYLHVYNPISVLILAVRLWCLCFVFSPPCIHISRANTRCKVHPYFLRISAVLVKYTEMKSSFSFLMIIKFSVKYSELTFKFDSSFRRFSIKFWFVWPLANILNLPDTLVDVL